MRLAEVIWKTLAEGPEERTALWTQGCSRRCSGCCNPEFWAKGGGHLWNPKELSDKIMRRGCHRLTILGGEPLEQGKRLTAFLKLFRSMLPNEADIWLFTGFTWAEVQAKKEFLGVVSLCDMVIAGPFQQKNTPDSRKWIGSTNQTVHALTPAARSFLPQWPKNELTIEFHFSNTGAILNGWPIVAVPPVRLNPGFSPESPNTELRSQK